MSLSNTTRGIEKKKTNKFSIIEHYSNYINFNIEKKPKKRSSSSTLYNKRKLSKKELLTVLHLPQTKACVALGCSISTLKRRFYELKVELGLEKWPQYFHEIRHLPIFPDIYPMSMRFILNEISIDDCGSSSDASIGRDTYSCSVTTTSAVASSSNSGSNE